MQLQASFGHMSVHEVKKITLKYTGKLDCHAQVSHKHRLNVFMKIKILIHWYDVKLRQFNGCRISKILIH